MPEVIDLLSSSPPRAQAKRTSPLPHRYPRSNDVFSFGSDDFNSTGELDFAIDQPVKRRRLSPCPATSKNQVTLGARDEDIFELSSEPDLLPAISQQTRREIVRAPNIDHNFDVEDNDTFRFSSSAPEPVARQPAKEPFILDLSSDAEIVADDPIQSSSQHILSSRPVFSERTANLLAGLHTDGASSFRKPRTKPRTKRSVSVDVTISNMTKFRQVTKPGVAPKDDILDFSSQLGNAKGRPGPAAKQPEPERQDNATAKPVSKVDKAAEKERKRQEKEQRALEKQKAADIAEVNKSKSNKKNSTPEMVVDMPASLQGLSVGNQVEEYMKELDVQVTFSRDEEVDLVSDHEVTLGSIIRWRRKVIADFDEDLEIWRPLPQPRTTRENHTIVYLKAEEFVRIAVVGQSSSNVSAADVSESTMRANVDAHISFLRSRHPKNTIVYLIEGLAAWNRKSATLKNRAYTAAVRSQVLQGDGDVTCSTVAASAQSKRTTTSKRKSKSTLPQIDLSAVTEDTTETLLLHLQLLHQPLMIQHTTSAATTASQIMTLTQHLSTRPYRLAEQNHNLASASFCMTTGQIRTGATPHETYINMLQEVNRVTPSMAYGISNAGYANVGKLVKGFREQGNLMLEDVRKSVNRDGAWSDRRLGPMVSKRLFRVFMGRDPGARDGIA